jgi:hypothetical protein
MEIRLPNRGHTKVGQRGSGHLAVSPSGWVAGLIKPAQRPCWLGDEAGGKPGAAEANTNQRLTLANLGRLTEDSQGFKPDLGNPAVRECVQRRLARSAGDSPAKARARSLVAWMAGRRETNDLKPIDRVIVRMTASHRAAAQANAQVAPKSGSTGGRARFRRVKAGWSLVGWLARYSTPAG